MPLSAKTYLILCEPLARQLCYRRVRSDHCLLLPLTRRSQSRRTEMREVRKSELGPLRSSSSHARVHKGFRRPCRSFSTSPAALKPVSRPPQRSSRAVPRVASTCTHLHLVSCGSYAEETASAHAVETSVVRSHFRKKQKHRAPQAQLCRWPLCQSVPDPLNLTLQKNTTQSTGKRNSKLVAHEAAAALLRLTSACAVFPFWSNNQPR